MGRPACHSGLPAVRLRGSGVGWVARGSRAVRRGAGCTALPAPTRPCPHLRAICVRLPALAHPLLLASLCPPAACAHPSLPAHLHHPPVPACLLMLPVLSRCLHLPTRRLRLPSFPARSCPRRVPPAASRGSPFPKTTGVGDRDGDLASTGHVPPSCDRWRGWRWFGGRGGRGGHGGGSVAPAA